jgi:GNAT superfamily N-acetyltransferase
MRPLDAELAPGAEIINAYFAYLLTSQSRTHGAVFVAEHDGRLIGYVCLFGQVPPEGADEIARPHSYIADLYVCPDFRRQGVGARLLEEAEQFVRRLGVHRIELKVLAANRHARRFYRHHGYKDRTVVVSKRLIPAHTDGDILHGK